MNDELNIPLLQDLVSKGQLDTDENHQQIDSNENHSVEFAQEDIGHDDIDRQQVGQEEITPEDIHIQEDLPDEILPDGEKPNDIYVTAGSPDELSEDASVRELIIDEEIRMILDKHMDKAYEEIIRLLNHKIS